MVNLILQFSLLLGCEKEDLIRNEQFFIDSYKTWFNICPTAGNHLGLKYSKESKRKMSESQKGNKYCLGVKHSEEFKQKRRNNKYGIRRKIIDIISNKIYESVTEAANKNGIKRTTLIMQLLNKNRNKTNLRYYG